MVHGYLRADGAGAVVRKAHLLKVKTILPIGVLVSTPSDLREILTRDGTIPLPE